jgi:hypothetical protein
MPSIRAESYGNTVCEGCGHDAPHLATLRAIGPYPMITLYKCHECAMITTVPALPPSVTEPKRSHLSTSP